MSGNKNKLELYRDKRDFRRTREPAGGKKKSGERPIFVIQKHDASRLHYDFRLEIDGTLKSWAVPKGPSTDPSEKRLAVETEDHPLEYADFEGTIPEGEYGGGTVMVWDTGWYRNLKSDEDDGKERSMGDAWKDGHLTFWLEGKKLRGGYALTRFRTERGKAQWLLVKMDDEAADAGRNPVSSQPESVLSARTLKQIADEEGGDDDE
ncbi:MAG: DNA polymerase ligase N-terminal domain-containing protein [Gammaproteobacteria bacterium]